MSEVWQRISVAAFLAIAGCTVTYFLTTSSKSNQLHSPDEQPVAMLVSIDNEVERRPSERLVWRRVFNNQLLYAGEAVRTDAGAMATLEFINKKTIVQLEPDTVVEIEKGGSGLNLDFLRGNLFIRSENPNEEVTLSSGGRKLQIQNAEVSFSKADPSANLEVEVTKGSVKESAPAKAEQKIELLSPPARQVVYVNPTEKHKLLVEWKPLPPGYKISVETGSSPQKLSKLLDATAADKVEISLPVGRHYFKVVAVDPSGKLPAVSSFARKIELRPKLAPILLEPINNAAIVAPSEKAKVNFRWANPGRLENIVLEVARSKDLRTDYGSQSTNNSEAFELQLRWNEGDVFWRVSGTVPQTKDAVASQIGKFTLKHGSLAEKLIPTPIPTVKPTPLATPAASPSPSPTSTSTPTPDPTPTPKQKIAAPAIDEATKKDGVIGKNDGTAQVNWKPVEKAKEYQLQIRNSRGELIQAQKVKGTSANLSGLKTGNYKVLINSVDQAGEVSADSAEVRVQIPEYSSVRAPKIKSMNIK